MQDLEDTLEFGLKVISHPQSLAITALNKMRTAKKVTFYEGFGGDLRSLRSLSQRYQKQ